MKPPLVLAIVVATLACWPRLHSELEEEMRCAV
jgi:hypothetical protein